MKSALCHCAEAKFIFRIVLFYQQTTTMTGLQAGKLPGDDAEMFCVSSEAETNFKKVSQSEKWDEMFHRLLKFRKENGHCMVPHRFNKDRQLGTWVSTQRRHYKALAAGIGKSASLTQERANRLTKIGFDWSGKERISDVRWETQFKRLLEYVVENGHALVPIGWKENLQLSNWVSNQRQEYKSLRKGSTTSLTQERIRLLDSVGFVWEALGKARKRESNGSDPSPFSDYRTTATRMLEEMQPSSSLEDTTQIGTGQKNAEASTMPITAPGRIDQFVGAESNGVQQYNKVLGPDSVISSASHQQDEIGNPSTSCGTKRKNETLAINDVKKNKVNDAEKKSHWERWEDMFRRLIEFREEHGHCMVPMRYSVDRQLGTWVATQRRHYKAFASGNRKYTCMTPERAYRLSEIGFDWLGKERSAEIRWEALFKKLLEYVIENGHALVPIGWEQNPQLANWVSNQRQEYKAVLKGKESSLTAERMNLLNAVGFVWEAPISGLGKMRQAVSLSNSNNSAMSQVQNTAKKLLETYNKSAQATTSTADASNSMVGALEQNSLIPVAATATASDSKSNITAISGCEIPGSNLFGTCNKGEQQSNSQGVFEASISQATSLSNTTSPIVEQADARTNKISNSCSISKPLGVRGPRDTPNSIEQNSVVASPATILESQASTGISPGNMTIDAKMSGNLQIHHTRASLPQTCAGDRGALAGSNVYVGIQNTPAANLRQMQDSASTQQMQNFVNIQQLPGTANLQQLPKIAGNVRNASVKQMSNNAVGVPQIPSQQVPNAMNVQTSVQQIQLQQVPNAMNIQPSVQQIPLQEVPNAINVQPSVQQIQLQQVPNAINIQPSVQQIQLQQVPNAMNVQPSVQQIPLQQVPNAMNVQPSVQQIPIQQVPNAMNVQPSVQQIPIQQVPNAMNVQPVGNLNFILLPPALNLLGVQQFAGSQTNATAAMVPMPQQVPQQIQAQNIPSLQIGLNQSQLLPSILNGQVDLSALVASLSQNINSPQPRTELASSGQLSVSSDGRVLSQETRGSKETS